MRICADLDGLLGVAVDPTRNAFAVDGAVADVSAPHASCKVFVVPTDEELEIATQTAEAAGVAPRAPVPAPRIQTLPKDANALPPVGPALLVDGGGATAPAELGLLFAALPMHGRLGFFRPVREPCGHTQRVAATPRPLMFVTGSRRRRAAGRVTDPPPGALRTRRRRSRTRTTRSSCSSATSSR